MYIPNILVMEMGEGSMTIVFSKEAQRSLSGVLIKSTDTEASAAQAQRVGASLVPFKAWSQINLDQV